MVRIELGDSDYVTRNLRSKTREKVWGSSPGPICGGNWLPVVLPIWAPPSHWQASALETIATNIFVSFPKRQNFQLFYSPLIRDSFCFGPLTWGS